MWKFEVSQKKFEVGKVRIGGLPGERPTVLIGTIFYYKQKIIINGEKGEFDEKAAEQIINAQDELSDITGNPCMLDVVASTPEAILKHLDFAAKITDMPLLMDGTTIEVRLAGLKYVMESGLTDRIIYNSLTPTCSNLELEKIKETQVKSAVLLAYNIQNLTSQGRIMAVEKLIPPVLESGIENILVDTFVLDIPTFGQACKAICEVKNKMGFPAGCGSHNAVATWRGLKMKMGEQSVKPAIAAISAITATVGADFVLYGPVEDAKFVFPAVSMVDAAIGQLVIEKGGKLDKFHPRYRIG